ncbi:hypothetical protein [Alsobacter sp. R-9]
MTGDDARTMAVVLIFEGADLTDELDCLLALVAAGHPAKKAALALDDARLLARTWAAAQSPEMVRALADPGEPRPPLN